MKRSTWPTGGTAVKGRSGLVSLLAVLAALSLVISACGSSDDAADSTSTTAGSSTTSDAALSGLDGLTANLSGQGSSFQDTFQQQVASDFGAVVSGAGGKATVTYTKTGSSDGKKSLAEKTVDFAGSDSPIKDEEKGSFGDRDILYFPIVGGPIAVAYNLQGVDQLNLSADTIAGIFQAEITTWNDPAITADNPEAKLPATKITVVHRSDGSGTTKNFTKYLVSASPDVWKLDSGETVNWPAGTQGAEKSSGVTKVISTTDGAIGYADLADAAKENLAVAAVKDAAGEFIAPTPDAASKALESAEVNDDLTFDPLNSNGEGAYPITSPTWMLVDAVQSDRRVADSLAAYLRYMLTTGQEQAKSLLYAPLPGNLAAKAVTQIDEIEVG